MVQRLSTIIADLGTRCQVRGWRVDPEPSPPLRVGVGGTSFVVDIRETTGPLSWRGLNAWIASYPEMEHLLLLTMGFLPPAALAAFFSAPTLPQRVGLVQLGLADYFETEFAPKKLGETNTAVFLALEEALEAKGVGLARLTCAHCSAPPSVACRECGGLICKSHFLRCPLCRAYLCHPDHKDCYFRHSC